jgi:sigma-B regulation protein RsbU (phosphoserine phosphatase)
MSPMRAKALYAVLALLFVVVATYRALDFSERLGDLRYGRTHVREPFDADMPEFRLGQVEEEAAAAGLMAGDVVRRIDGRPVRYLMADLWVPLRRASAGDRLVVDFWRPGTPPGATQRASIVLRPLRTGAVPVAEWVGFALFNVALPLFCTVLGFWVAAVRVTDGRAWLLLLLVLSLPEFAGGYFRFLGGRDDLVGRVAAAYQPLLANIWPTAMLFFALSFPERLAIDRRFPWLKWVVIVPIAIRVIGLNPVYDFVARRDPPSALRLQDSLAWTETYFGTSYPLFILLFLGIMAYRAYTEPQRDARRRLWLVLAGAGLSVAPLVAFLVGLALGVRNLPEWVFLIIVGPLLLFPLTMAYAIVVHRAMDVRVVVRQGLQYLLARGSLRALQLVVSSATLAGAIVLVSRSASFATQALSMAVGLSIVVLVRRFSETLRERVDRRFFRDAYDADQILSELADKVRTMIETRPLLEMVTHRIAEALHVPRVAILLNEGGRLSMAYGVGFADSAPVAIAASGATARRLQREPHVPVHVNEADSWVKTVGDEERRALAHLESELLLPLSLNQKLVGVMSLGAKRSEEPYSPSDLRLLGSVATQAGLALENSRLNGQITLEIAEREKRGRELEIAREVQERLFPQSYPPVQGLELAGACRPALAVGGDYYDFIPLGAGRLGIAIGDISGKGIPAALLMATLRAFLRGQTVRGRSDLAGLIADLSGLVYESSAPNRYATFFYAEYDPASGRLVYVNGGHNPPVVLRGGAAGPAETVRLDAGGPVIGLLPECAYEQGEVQLGAGDLLVAFTDGVSEAMNGAQEEWGEERLLPVLQQIRCEPPAVVIERVMAAADAYVAGAPQHDDMTLVVVKCTD